MIGRPVGLLGGFCGSHRCHQLCAERLVVTIPMEGVVGGHHLRQLVREIFLAVAVLEEHVVELVPLPGPRRRQVLVHRPEEGHQARVLGQKHTVGPAIALFSMVAQLTG